MKTIKIIISATIIALLFSACGATKNKTATKTIPLTKAEFLTIVANYETNPDEWKYLGDKPALIDFHATWCGPCRTLTPIINELAEEFGSEIYVYTIDVDEEQELAQLFDVRSIPSLLFIPMNGKPQMTGGMTKGQLRDNINRLLLNIQ